MEELEDLRKNIKSDYRKSFIITLIVFNVAVIIFLSFAFKSIFKIDLSNINILRVAMFLAMIAIPLIFSLVVAFIVASISVSQETNEFNKKFKEIFIIKSLNKYFTDLVYKPDEGIKEEVLENTHMIDTGDIYESNDYISAKYKGIAFEQADVDITEERETKDSKGNTTTEYITLFKGRWMIFDFNKTFKANIQISQKGFGNSYVNRYCGNEEDKFKEVKMESEEFNKRFNIYAQNEHDAFYIITPSFMQKIQKLDDENEGELLFCFIDNKLHIGLYDEKDAFEPESPFKPINEEQILENVSKDIKTITQFIDELNLDNSLFTKEV